MTFMSAVTYGAERPLRSSLNHDATGPSKSSEKPGAGTRRDAPWSRAGRVRAKALPRHKRTNAREEVTLAMETHGIVVLITTIVALLTWRVW